jgi:hypothetical protein
MIYIFMNIYNQQETTEKNVFSIYILIERCLKLRICYFFLFEFERITSKQNKKSIIYSY